MTWYMTPYWAGSYKLKAMSTHWYTSRNAKAARYDSATHTTNSLVQYRATISTCRRRR